MSMSRLWICVALVSVLAAACVGRPVALEQEDPSLLEDGGPPAPLDSSIAPDSRPPLAPDTRAWPDTRPPDLGPPIPGKWITLPAGSFTMGSPKQEPCRLPHEDRHQVTLSHRLQISTTEVTQAQYLGLMGENPSHFSSCPGCAVESVTWHAAVVYCNRLSLALNLERCYRCDTKDGQYAYPYECSVRPPYDGTSASHRIHDCKGFRLPTEAEWEYAYRAGSSTALHNGAITRCHDDDRARAVGWISVNSGGKTQPVGQRKANAWGLYDMGGNVWEWVNDWYSPNLGGVALTDPAGPKTGVSRVFRGGSWTTDSGGIRAASRSSIPPQYGFSTVGFRCVRSLPK